MSDDGQVIDDILDESQIYDIKAHELVEHRFDRIIGNQLICSLHPDGDCPVIFVKPTEVLEKGADGELHLIDKTEQ